ncbi:MAG: Fmu (Sun) domain-containing protein, partial [Deltaproteobacteria bacterium]|nr:Fmu (Sun) domain-containing protein [Deltaproteobacteria bacterium]
MSRNRSSSLPPARQEAWKGLALCLDNGLPAQAALDRVLGGLESVLDRALATELFYGLLRHKTRMEWTTAQYLDRPDRLPPLLRRILALGAFELLMLDHVPAYATVDWATGLGRTLFGARMGGLVNAVLRKVDRDRERLMSSRQCRELAGSEKNWLSIWHSCPEWMVDLWRRWYPDRVAALTMASCSQPPVGLRCDPTVAALASEADVVAKCRTGLAVRTLGPELTQALGDGLADRQSMAAQEALLALASESWPTPAWDACCGRGGKSFVLADLGLGPIWASDVHKGRVVSLAGHPDWRSGANRAWVGSALAPPLRSGRPGTVLLDVPCSGLGVCGRRPDIKWKRTPGDVSGLTALQRDMIRSARSVLS